MYGTNIYRINPDYVMLDRMIPSYSSPIYYGGKSSKCRRKKK